MASRVLWIKRSSYKGLVYGSVAVRSNMSTTKTTDDLRQQSIRSQAYHPPFVWWAVHLYWLYLLSKSDRLFEKRCFHRP